MKKSWVLVALFGLLSIVIVIFQLASFGSGITGGFVMLDRPEPLPWSELLPGLLLMKVVLTSVNIILLLILLVTYMDIYLKTKSEFSLGLIVFTITLLMYAATSNPLLQELAGFRLSGLGPFTILPDLFTTIATAILLYLSQQ